jgi:DNA primase
VTAAPNASRPAAQIRFLQGFEQPALFQKAPNTQRIGGGIDAQLGDFQTMASEFKGLVAFGGVLIEPKSIVGSNGSGS